ncbi:MAG: diadenylate cyclase CdaA [Eubacteriales bacterium]
MDQLIISVKSIFTGFLTTDITWIGIVEILIIAVFAYQLILWIKNTKAWMLLRGILVILAFILVAEIFEMTTILYLVERSMNVIAMTAVVVFQPEIRRALENIGQKNILSAITPFEIKKENTRFSLTTVESIVDACVAMSKVKTGALIVIEDDVKLQEYEETGIRLDCIVSSQVLLNIFEHNTPLHDGAIIVRGDRIAAATCYLPLTDNMHLSKDLGTRHRAAVGMSEVSDALVIAVSEETGNISTAKNGNLNVNITAEELSFDLSRLRITQVEEAKPTLYQRVIKGGTSHEK